MTIYRTTVYGVIWQGCKASTAYDFDHRPTREEVIARAADFQLVVRVRLTKIEIALTPCTLAA
jgi:hypothetical protein